MELRLQLLDTFTAEGSDGATYKVCAYDRLVPDLSLAGSGERWESTGEVEYRLADGRLVEAASDGTTAIARTGVRLALQPRARPGA